MLQRIIRTGLGLLTLCLVPLSVGAIDTEKLKREVPEAIERFKRTDSTITALFEKSHGYAVLPSIGKGGLVFGGAGGAGHVYEKEKFIGLTRLSQFTFGAQIGGQVFSEILFFEDASALERFKAGGLKLTAQATAVAAAEGAAAHARYDHGVIIFTLPKGGLMAEASVGGQTFEFIPASP